MDQAMALMADTFPPMLHRYFTSLKESGFAESTALLLTAEAQKTILVAIFTPTSKSPPSEG